MPDAPFRIAIVGLDHWYAAFGLAEAVASHDGARLVAIADKERGRLTAYAQRSGVDRIEEDLSSLLEDPDIDVIASFISVDQNPKLCIAAAQAGKHIISVKPFARTVEEGTEVAAAVRAAGVHFWPSECGVRLGRAHLQIKQWLDEERLGRILSVQAGQWASLPQRWPGDSDPGWFIDPARAPGGAWIDHSIYQLDLLRWLLDDEVARIGGHVARVKYPDLPFEDYGCAMVEFQGGVVATVEDTWLAPPNWGRRWLSIVGDEGALSYDSLSGRLAVSGRFAPFDRRVEMSLSPAAAEGLPHFLAVVGGEMAPVATVEDALRNLTVCCAFYESAKQPGSLANIQLGADDAPPSTDERG